ncbi:hypothetical protein NFI96_025701, partial [Prochilodus magdalenae]
VKNTEEAVTETPTSVRRTRRRVIVTDQPQSDSQQDDAAERQNPAPSAPANSPQRQTRRSKRHPTDANQPDSTHEADVSESESCCSVASSLMLRSATRSRRRAVGNERPTAAGQQEASEGESCSSPPASKPRRTMRSQKKSVMVPAESTTLEKDDHSEAESCSSVASLSKVMETRRITRSRRRTAVSLGGDDPSEADSCSSAVSGPQGSTVRRSTRNRGTKPTEPIPIHLEESEPSKSSTASSPIRTRRGRSTVRPADENQANDSEGCHSGPSASPRRVVGVFVFDSDSESVATNCTSMDSPSSVKVRLTPCSSRTGSASSNRAVPASRTRSKVTVTHDLSNATLLSSKGEKLDSKESELVKDQEANPMDTVSNRKDVEEMEEEETNRTVISADDQECSILGNVTLTLDEDEDVISKESGPARPQAATLIEAVSDREDVEEMDEKETNRTVKRTDDLTLTLDEDEDIISSPSVEAKMVESENREETSPIKGVTVYEKDEAFEENPEWVADVTVVDQKHSDLAERSVKVSEGLDECEAANVLDVPQEVSVSQTISTNSDPASPKVEDEQEMVVEKHSGIDAGRHQSELPIPSKAQDGCPAERVEDGPSSSSNAQEDKTSIPPNRPEKVMVSLLDSSEDEESDDGLSDEGCKEEAGHLESEDEAVHFDENQPGPSEETDAPHSSGLFVIDTRPGLQPSEKYFIDDMRQEQDDHVDDSKAVKEDEEEFVDEEGADDEDDDDDSKTIFTSRKPALMALSSAIDPGLKMKELGGLYISFDGSKSKALSSNLKRLKDQKNQDELLKKSVIVADFEKKDAVPLYKESQHAAKLKRKEERAKTTGDGWFNMKAPELTDELKNDLKALKMRSAMDPKRFYKKNDRDGFPKYFQVGKVVDNPADFYHSRIPKKQRKRTVVEELLADAEFRSFNKRKYQEIVSEKAAEAAGRMNVKKHKFHKKK